MSQSHSVNGVGGGGNPNPAPRNSAVHYPVADPPGLTRYGSAPGSLLSRVADSIIAGDGGFRASGGTDGQMSRFFPRESSCVTAESSCKAGIGGGGASAGVELQRSGEGSGNSVSAGLRQPFDLGGDGTARDLLSSPAGGEPRTGGSHLMRQHSSPAGFFSHLMVDNGKMLKSQLSFSRQDTVSQISEISIPEMGESSDEAAGNVGHSYMTSSYPVGSWEETNSIVFCSPNKRSRDKNGDIISTLNNIDSHYDLSGTSIDMAAVDKLLQIQHDSVPFKIRAKRGCATHPRSIAERERRTRISEKLRKLQDLVPNMDKQTSTADMLDLAVQHIKGLQSQIQVLKDEQAGCTCASLDQNH